MKSYQEESMSAVSIKLQGVDIDYMYSLRVSFLMCLDTLGGWSSVGGMRRTRK